MFGKMLGHFEKNCLKVKTVVSTFLATFEEIGALLTFSRTQANFGKFFIAMACFCVVGVLPAGVLVNWGRASVLRAGRLCLLECVTTQGD